MNYPTGKYDVDTVAVQTSRVDALAQRLDRLNIPSPVRMYAVYETYGVQGHTFVKCYYGSFTIEHANDLHNFNPPS